MSQNSYWDAFERNVIQLIAILERRQVFDMGSKVENKSCFSTAANLYFIIPGLVLSGMSEKAKECAEIGLHYVKIAKETGDRRDITRILDVNHAAYSLAYMEYYFKWYLTGQEDVELILFSLDKLQQVAGMYKQKGKSREYKDSILQIVIIAIKSKQLDVASKYAQIMLSETSIESVSCIPHSEQHFLYEIVDCLCCRCADAQLVQEAFNIFFNELKNGNTNFIKGYLTINDIAEIAFIYHKYFSKTGTALPVPDNIIRSVRYGIN